MLLAVMSICSMSDHFCLGLKLHWYCFQLKTRNISKLSKSGKFFYFDRNVNFASTVKMKSFHFDINVEFASTIKIKSKFFHFDGNVEFAFFTELSYLKKLVFP